MKRNAKRDYRGEVAMVRAEEAAYQARLDAVRAKVARREVLNVEEENLYNNNLPRRRRYDMRFRRQVNR